MKIPNSSQEASPKASKTIKTSLIFAVPLAIATIATMSVANVATSEQVLSEQASSHNYASNTYSELANVSPQKDDKKNQPAGGEPKPMGGVGTVDPPVNTIF